MKKSQTKSKDRISDFGEVFTAEREVNAMLDLVKHETERIESRFCSAMKKQDTRPPFKDNDA